MRPLGSAAASLRALVSHPGDRTAAVFVCGYLGGVALRADNEELAAALEGELAAVLDGAQQRRALVGALLVLAEYCPATYSPGDLRGQVLQLLAERAPCSYAALSGAGRDLPDPIAAGLVLEELRQEGLVTSEGEPAVYHQPGGGTP